MERDKNIESLLEANFNEDNTKTALDNLGNSEETLLEEDDRVAADLIEDVATAVDSEEAAAEQQRIIDERGALIPQGASDIDDGSDKASRISTNRSDEIVDNQAKTGMN